MAIKKGDTVVVITGRDKGKSGKVIEVDQDRQRVRVERINFVKRHQKPTQSLKQGGIIEKEASLHLSNVMLIDPASGKGTRVGVKKQSDGSKVRISRRSGEIIEATK